MGRFRIGRIYPRDEGPPAETGISSASIPLLHKRPMVVIISLAVLIMAYICCGLRFYLRLRVTRCPGWDDLFLCLSLMASSALTVATCIARGYGLGEHFAELGTVRIRSFIKSFYVCNGAYCLATPLIKIALLLQYLRIFPANTARWRASLVLVCVTGLWGASYSAIAWFPCLPLSAHWDLGAKAEAAWGFGSEDPAVFSGTYISHVATNMALDMAVSAMALTIPRAGRPHASSLASIAALGVLALSVNSVALFRLISIGRSRAGTYPDLDPSWYACIPAILATVEINLAAVCASLPIFWPTLCPRPLGITVTREFTVTTEERNEAALASPRHDDTLCAPYAPHAFGSGPRAPRALGHRAKLGLSAQTRIDIRAAAASSKIL